MVLGSWEFECGTEAEARRVAAKPPVPASYLSSPCAGRMLSPAAGYRLFLQGMCGVTDILPAVRDRLLETCNSGCPRPTIELDAIAVLLGLEVTGADPETYSRILLAALDDGGAA